MTIHAWQFFFFWVYGWTNAWRGLITGIFGILESSATQWYQDVASTWHFFFHHPFVLSIVYGYHVHQGRLHCMPTEGQGERRWEHFVKCVDIAEESTIFISYPYRPVHLALVSPWSTVVSFEPLPTSSISERHPLRSHALSRNDYGCEDRKKNMAIWKTTMVTLDMSCLPLLQNRDPRPQKKPFDQASARRCIWGTAFKPVWQS
jgi:hypothetical protein